MRLCSDIATSKVPCEHEQLHNEFAQFQKHRAQATDNLLSLANLVATREGILADEPLPEPPCMNDMRLVRLVASTRSTEPTEHGLEAFRNQQRYPAAEAISQSSLLHGLLLV